MVANVVDLTRTSIERQAKQWLIRMDGDEPLTDSERESLQEWMSRSAFHAGELTRIARLWRRANVMTDLFGGLDAQRRDKRQALAARWKWTLMAATALLSSVILVCCGLQQSRPPQVAPQPDLQGQTS